MMISLRRSFFTSSDPIEIDDMDEEEELRAHRCSRNTFGGCSEMMMLIAFIVAPWSDLVCSHSSSSSCSWRLSVCVCVTVALPQCALIAVVVVHLRNERGKEYDYYKMMPSSHRMATAATAVTHHLLPFSLLFLYTSQQCSVLLYFIYKIVIQLTASSE